MTFLHLVALSLATWVLTYILVFSLVCERLRAAVGISYDLDNTGEATDRWAEGPIASILNCYSCTALLLAPVVYLIWYLGAKGLIYILAAAGAVQIIGRWHISQRPRREWWL